MYGALEVLNFMHLHICLWKMYVLRRDEKSSKFTYLPLVRFDTFESGRHEDLLLQYPQVVDILLFVAEHFRSTIYVHMSNSILLQHDKMLLTTAVHLREKT